MLNLSKIKNCLLILTVRMEVFMSVQLLDKTRKINKLLHNNNSHKVVFNDICEVLSNILLSNVLVISRKGKVLGIKNRQDWRVR